MSAVILTFNPNRPHGPAVLRDFAKLSTDSRVWIADLVTRLLVTEAEEREQTANQPEGA